MYYYLASPYEKIGRNHGYNEALDMVERLYNHKIPVYSPIVHNHHLSDRMNRGHDHNFWIDIIDKPMILSSGGMIILDIGGWKESTGVNLEINICREHDKPIYLLKKDFTNFDRELFILTRNYRTKINA